MMKFTQEQIGIVKALLLSAPGDAVYRAKIMEIIDVIDGEASPVRDAVLYVDIGPRAIGYGPTRKYVLDMPEAREHVTWTEDIDSAMVFRGVRNIEQGRKEVERRTHIGHGVIFV